MSAHDQILNTVNEYYTGKIKTFGATPQGVDWNGEESQFLRFEQLAQNLLAEKEKVSVLDYGCGYGSLLGFLERKGVAVEYTGFDISESMLREAAKTFPGSQHNWISEIDPQKKYDYVLLSGIFNVKLQAAENAWVAYIEKTLAEVNALARKEFSFNILTSYSDAEYMRDYLYYASPESWFGYCKRHFSKQVVLNHGYPLYEFTIQVIKS